MDPPAGNLAARSKIRSWARPNCGRFEALSRWDRFWPRTASPDASFVATNFDSCAAPKPIA